MRFAGFADLDEPNPVQPICRVSTPVTPLVNYRALEGWVQYLDQNFKIRWIKLLNIKISNVTGSKVRNSCIKI